MMGFKERFSRRRSPEGIRIERNTYSLSGDIPLPLALHRVKELKKGNRIKRFIGRLRRTP